MKTIKLNDEERKALVMAQDMLDEARRGIAKLRGIGVDVSDLEQQLEDTGELGKRILENF